MKERLQYIITNEGLTNLRFAEMLGVNPASISHILTERNKPSFDFIVKIAEKLPHYDLRWLLTGKGAPMVEAVVEQPGTSTPSAQPVVRPLIAESVSTGNTQVQQSAESTTSTSSHREAVKPVVANPTSTKLIVCFPDGTFDEYTHR